MMIVIMLSVVIEFIRSKEKRKGEEDKANDQVRRYPRRIIGRPNYFHETSV